MFAAGVGMLEGLKVGKLEKQTRFRFSNATDSPSSSSIQAEKAAVEGWSIFVQFTWAKNASPDQIELSKALFGKEPKDVTYEEYWKAVDAYLHNTLYNEKTVTLDTISYRVHTHVESESKMQWVNIDPTKNGSWAATSDRSYMTFYKINEPSQRWGYGSVVRKDGTLEVRVDYPVDVEINNITWTAGPFIEAMNHLSYPISYQDIGDVNFDPTYFDNLDTYNPKLAHVLVTSDGIMYYSAIGIEK